MKTKQSAKKGAPTTRKPEVPPVVPDNEKKKQMEQFVDESTGTEMRTNTGLGINDDHNSLKAGERGGTLLEDFILREKITHFDHERIPERVVHARGSGAHGVFKLYKAIPELTKAGFLNNTDVETPVFVRFSTVAGSRGSTDLARDVRGFAVRFYTQEGNFDLVGNNMPVFFIQDAMKFPDLVHAVKPEPDNEIPQAASAHDTFWDFISLTPESAHMIMWLMSDRAIPRSYRMMEGFGVHTFRFINAEGTSHFVKFHWKPLLGVHNVAWDEAQKISGKDPDFHRRDLWDAIASGAFAEWELGVQIVPEDDEHKYEFDLLDPTKIIPEELVPVKRIGKMTLNRNPDNFFAETEQAAFHLGHIVPGIDFTNDPLLQGRLFSYTDTQLLRLGGPNFQEIPINRPVVPVRNNQRDGFMRQAINRGKSSYSPNTTGDNYPAQVKAADGGFTSHQERIEGSKIRRRSKSFFDHFSQAKLFYDSQAPFEKQHLKDALSFELGKVKLKHVRERMLYFLAQIDKGLAGTVATSLGLSVPSSLEDELNQNIPADGNPADYASVKVKSAINKSETLSTANTVKDSIKSRKVAFLVSDGVDGQSVSTLKKAIESEGGVVMMVAAHLGTVSADNGESFDIDESSLTAASVLVDAVYVPGGKSLASALKADANAIHFLNEAYRHCKPIAIDATSAALLDATYIVKDDDDPGVLTDSGQDLAAQFIEAIKKHRFWDRELNRKVPA